MENIAIILALYNGREYIDEQLNSIMNNSYKDICVHIFDDGEDDGAKIIIEKYIEKYKGKVFYHKNKQNKGVINNFLDGIKEIDAKYYMLCDQDDVWLQDKIKHSLAYIEKCGDDNSTPVVIFGDAKVTDKKLNEISPSFQRQSGYNTSATDLNHLLMENKLIGCTMMFNDVVKKMLKAHDNPEYIRMHDWWIGILCAAFGTVKYLDEPLLLYRQHGDNVVGNISKGNYIKNRISHFKASREALYDTCKQAECFLKYYGDILPGKEREIIEKFATIPEKNWIARRKIIIQNKFFKSGFIRNIGILVLI